MRALRPPVMAKCLLKLLEPLEALKRCEVGRALAFQCSYAKIHSRSHNAVIRVFDETGNVIGPVRGYG
jgi:hypothetical protein